MISIKDKLEFYALSEIFLVIVTYHKCPNTVIQSCNPYTKPYRYHFKPCFGKNPETW
jgi:hypothetical protein